MNSRFLLEVVIGATVIIGLPSTLAASPGNASYAEAGAGLTGGGPGLLGVPVEEARAKAEPSVAMAARSGAAAAASAEAVDVRGLSAAVATNVQQAVTRLSPQVSRKSHGQALQYAFRAYYRYRSAHPDEVRNPYLYFVDFGLSSDTPRGYVFDMVNLRVVRGPFHVAHGRGSAPGGTAVPTRFMNTNGSNATSLGLYLAQETYNFSGTSGGRSYRSVGLRLKGVSGNFNDRARVRGVVAHGAPYVTGSNAGRSEGCPAMPLALASELLPEIANGGMVFHFSPADVNWMRSDPWGAPGV
ncbi:MAG: murein L,D-transpeptidase catalytic domain family protein [Gemmatimonadota bacterium]|jgi:hypothetical protein|nr:murein L,D-transpeptidase catalytic domain family protein [Gemmatimonadota bacterium]